MTDEYDAASIRHHQDASVLYKNQRYDNALYHAFFALECGLKFCLPEIMRTQGTNAHNLLGLLNTLNRTIPGTTKIPFYDKSFYGFPNFRYWKNGYAKAEDVEYAIKFWEKNLKAQVVIARLNGGQK